MRGNVEHAEENRREETLPNETTRQYQGPFLRTGQSNNARTLTSNPTTNERSTKIINLSRKKITNAEQKILEKGLKFTPTPEKENSYELKQDLFEFERKLRLAEYFFGKEDTDISIVRNKSNFIPKKNRNAALEKYVENLQNTPTTKSSTSIRYNISLAERKAIKSLANDKSVVIIEADKGGAVVIMDRGHYKTMVESRKENPQKLTQLSSKSHPRHLVRKRTAQKDTIIDITSDSQVNSNFPYRWSPASLTFNNYFLPIFIFIYNHK